MASDYQIRDAELKDVPGLVRCARNFFKYAKYEEFGMPLDDESFVDMVCEYINSSNCKCLVTEKDGKVVGSVCGVITPWVFNRNIPFAYEAFYWMESEHRGRVSIKMLSEYEDWVQQYGAVSVMIQPETNLTEKVGKLYEKRGYKPLEHFWVRTCL
jgi:hypothetical protein